MYCLFGLCILYSVVRRYGLLQTAENAFDNGRKTTSKKKKSWVILNFGQYDIHARGILQVGLTIQNVVMKILPALNSKKKSPQKITYFISNKIHSTRWILSLSEENGCCAGWADFQESFGTFIHLHESGFRTPSTF